MAKPRPVREFFRRHPKLQPPLGMTEAAKGYWLEERLRRRFQRRKLPLRIHPAGGGKGWVASTRVKGRWIRAGGGEVWIALARLWLDVEDGAGEGVE